MAVEQRRLCGYRKVHGLYLCAPKDALWTSCDRLPLGLEQCPVCGGGLKLTRGFLKINPWKLFGNHLNCQDRLVGVAAVPLPDAPATPGGCLVCRPDDTVGFITWVGKAYYDKPSAFVAEAVQMGVSKRIPQVPRGLKPGETPVYVAHPALPQEDVKQWLNSWGDEKRENYAGAIFTAFVPDRVEYLVWESEAKDTEKMDALRKRGLTIVPIPDGDADHTPEPVKPRFGL
jgi:hypothetical protein